MSLSLRVNSRHIAHCLCDVHPQACKKAPVSRSSSSEDEADEVVPRRQRPPRRAAAVKAAALLQTLVKDEVPPVEVSE